MQSGPNSNQIELQHNIFSRFVGTAAAAFVEQVGLHPVDTLAKKAMTGESAIQLVVKLLKEKGAVETGKTLYRGFGIAFAKKGPLRVYKYMFQDELNDLFTRHYKEAAQNHFGSYGKVVISAAAGGVGGVLEPVLFHWIDTLPSFWRKKFIFHCSSIRFERIISRSFSNRFG